MEEQYEKMTQEENDLLFRAAKTIRMHKKCKRDGAVMRGARSILEEFNYGKGKKCQ